MSGFPWLPPDHSTHGPQLDQMLGWVHWLMLALFVGWGAYFIYALFRFRRGKNPKASYTGFHNHRFSLMHESAVALVEVILLVGFAFPLWAKVKTQAPPEDAAVKVHIVAEQFAWNIHYPGADNVFGRRDIKLVSAQNPLGLDRTDPAAKDDITTINQLHVPVHQLALIQLSTKDVIHSFFLPTMRVKQDAIPGMSIPVWFEASQTEKSEIACAQLCGLGHYRMRGYLSVDDPADYQAWLKENAPAVEAPPAESTTPAPGDSLAHPPGSAPGEPGH
jgi:cytochrome c oxidase subunit 2